MTAEQPMPSPDQLPPVHTDEDLLDRWRLLLAAETYDDRTLWVTWYDEHDVQLPVVVPVDASTRSPEPEFLDKLADMMQGILRQVDGGWVSLALARPGAGLITIEDRRWADEISTVLNRRGLPGRPLFLATTGRIRQLVLDGP